MSSQESLRVVCRVRPSNSREKGLNSKECLKIKSSEEIEIKNENRSSSFNYDHILGKDTTQEIMYNAAVHKKMVSDVINGFSGTIFAYGQTGAGKTWSMEGNLNDQKNWGIIPSKYKVEEELLVVGE